MGGVRVRVSWRLVSASLMAMDGDVPDADVDLVYMVNLALRCFR